MYLKHYSPFIPTELDDFDNRIYEQLSATPFENIFSQNLQELKTNSTQIEFKTSRYNMRPDLVAWDHYRSLALTHLIMLVNNCPTFFKFTREYIGDTLIIPDKLYIQKLLNSNI